MGRRRKAPYSRADRKAYSAALRELVFKEEPPMKKHVFEIIAVGEIEPDFVSRRIQKFIDADYSHSAILVDGETIYHATGIGFHRIPLLELLPGHIIRHRIRFELEGEAGVFAKGWLEGCIGTEYSHSQYLGFFFPFLRRFVDNNRAKTVCSEAVGDFMAECLGIRDHRLLNCDFLSPRDVTEIAYEHAEKITERE
jgi:hypothetical protein